MHNLLTIAGTENLTAEIVDYYGRFPPEYEALCDEAERRFLIHRGAQKEGLVRRRK